jgi:hypothetical protein
MCTSIAIIAISFWGEGKGGYKKRSQKERVLKRIK